MAKQNKSAAGGSAGKTNRAKPGSRVPVLKTYKLFIGGKFPRSESGRYYSVERAGQVLANICLASRKDFREAVVAARSAVGGWASRAAFNRGQILYRAAEMLEGRREQFVAELKQHGHSAARAAKETDQAIDRLIYYSGWCDKYQQIFSTVNPVASSHFNFSAPENMGVVAAVAPEDSPLLGLISLIAPAIAGGNSVVVLASESQPLPAVTLAEVLATSDLPGGVINILTGQLDELAEHMARHMDVNALVMGRNVPAEQKKQLELWCVDNVKRFIDYSEQDWSGDKAETPYMILKLSEIKTTWHPIEKVGAAGSGY